MVTTIFGERSQLRMPARVTWQTAERKSYTVKCEDMETALALHDALSSRVAVIRVDSFDANEIGYRSSVNPQAADVMTCCPKCGALDTSCALYHGKGSVTRGVADHWENDPES